jgi:hypothetical protein
MEVESSMERKREREEKNYKKLLELLKEVVLCSKLMLKSMLICENYKIHVLHGERNKREIKVKYCGCCLMWT